MYFVLSLLLYGIICLCITIRLLLVCFYCFVCCLSPVVCVIACLVVADVLNVWLLLWLCLFYCLLFLLTRLADLID